MYFYNLTKEKKLDRIDTIIFFAEQSSAEKKAMMGKENRNSCAFRESAVGASRYHLRRIAHPVATERKAGRRKMRRLSRFGRVLP